MTYCYPKLFQPRIQRNGCFVALLLLVSQGALAFTPSCTIRLVDSRNSGLESAHVSLAFASSSRGENTVRQSSSSDEEQNEPVVNSESVVRIDDGGSDLSDRFKYKVNALMGVFDPATGVDDERQEGNILNAMLQFPVLYSFNVVGKTLGEDDVKQSYVDSVKDVVASLSGDRDGMECRITSRGKNFTRITLLATVDSVAVINSIYDGLEKLDRTVMRY